MSSVICHTPPPHPGNRRRRCAARARTRATSATRAWAKRPSPLTECRSRGSRSTRVDLLSDDFHVDEADGQEDVDVDADAVDGERIADAADEAGDAAAMGAA